MRTIPNFENFDMNETITAVGFGMGGVQNFGFGGSTPQTGYSMNSIAGTVGQSAAAIGTQAHDYEMNDNDDHTAEGYLTEAKKHVNESIDKAYESCKAMNEAMIQIAGKDKPSGAKVLAQVIIVDLVEKGYMKLVTNKRQLDNMVSDVQDIIIKSTF
jgi:hypothetical protein